MKMLLAFAFVLSACFPVFINNSPVYKCRAVSKYYYGYGTGTSFDVAYQRALKHCYASSYSYPCRIEGCLRVR